MSLRNHRQALSLTAKQQGWLSYLAKRHDCKVAEMAYRLFTQSLGAEMTRPEHNAERIRTYQEEYEDVTAMRTNQGEVPLSLPPLSPGDRP